MSKWEKVRLGDLGTFRTGGTPSRANPDFFRGNIPWITTVSLGKKIITANDAVEFISEEALQKSSAKLIKANSIMVGIRVGVGKSSINTVDMATNQDIVSIEDIDEKLIYKPYLLCFLNSCSELFSSQKRGATIQGISSDVLKSLLVPLPPMNIQQQIAYELDTVSELLTLRKRQLEELDRLIKSVFYEMFGDPVANEKGWHLKKLSDIFNIIDGDRGKFYPKQEDFFDEGFCLFLSAKNVTREGFVFDETNFISEKKDTELRKGRLTRGDIVITTRGTVGNIAFYDEEVKYEVIRINSGMVILRRKSEEISPIYFCKLFSHDSFASEILKLKSGTAQPQLPIKNMKELLVPLPPIDKQNSFVGIVEKIESQKSLVNQSIDETQRLFDSLMSKYFDD